MTASLTSHVMSHLCDLQMRRPAGLGPEMRGSLQQERELHRHHEVQQKRSLRTLLRDTNSRCPEPPDERSRCTRVLCCTSLRPYTVSSGTSNRYLGCPSLSRATMYSCAAFGNHQRGVGRPLWCRVLNSCLLWSCSCPCRGLYHLLSLSAVACPSRCPRGERERWLRRATNLIHHNLRGLTARVGDRQKRDIQSFMRCCGPA